MKLNLNKKPSFDENDRKTGKNNISEVIDWLFSHNEKECRKIGIKQNTTGEEKLCFICKELGLLQEKERILTKAQERAAEKAAEKENAIVQELAKALAQESLGFGIEVE